MSGSRKWNGSDQFPIWFVALVALTLQYQVLPVSSVEVISNVWLVISKPVSVQLVAIIKSGELKVEVVSISMDQPPILTPAEDKFQDN